MSDAVDAAVKSYFATWAQKSAPAGLGLYGSGGTYGPAFLDRYRKQRVPYSSELVAQYRNAVYVCCHFNANGVAATPLKLYVETAKGVPRPKCKTRPISTKQQEWLRKGWYGHKSSSALSGRIASDSDVDEVADHPILDLFAKPNPYFGWGQLTKLSTLYKDIVGASYWWIGNRARLLGTPREIWPLPSHQVWPWRDDPMSKEPVEYFMFVSGRMQQKFPVKDVIQDRFMNPWEPYSVPMGPLQATFEHVTVTEQSLGHMQALLDNQGRPDAVLTPEEVIGEAESRRLMNRWKSNFAGAGFGGLFVTESAMKLQPLSWAPVDLGILEQYNVTHDMIMDAFGVPQSYCTKETNLANLQAAERQHAKNGILPRCNDRDETLNRCLVPLYDDTGRLFLASDNPIPDDRAQDSKEATDLMSAGSMTRNEHRSKHGLDPVPWGDQPLVPSSMQPVDEKGNPKAPLVPVGPDGKPVVPRGTDDGPGAAGGKNRKKDGKNGKQGKKDKKKSTKSVPGPSILQALESAGESVKMGKITPRLAAMAIEREFGLDAAQEFRRSCKKLNKSPVTRHKGDVNDEVDKALQRLDAAPDNPENDAEIAVPFVVDLEPGYPVDAVLTEDQWLNVPTVIVALRELCATQHYVERRTVKEFVLDQATVNIEDRGEFVHGHHRIPRIVRTVDGDLYIDNGHHHLTAMWLLGRGETTARLYDHGHGRGTIKPIADEPSADDPHPTGTDAG